MLKRKACYFLEYLLVIFIFSIVFPLPLRVALKFGEFLGLLFFLFSRKYKKRAEKNIEIVFGKSRKSILKKFFLNLGRNTVLFFKIPSINKRFVKKYIQIKGKEYLDKVKEKEGCGIILVGGHLGNWELIPPVLNLLGYKVNLLVYEQHNFFVNKFINKIRKSKGKIDIYSRGKVDIVQLLRLLKRGEILGIVADQYTKDGIDIEFLGIKSRHARGPAVLKKRTNAELIFTSLLNDDKKFILEFTVINQNSSVYQITKGWVRELEKKIYKNPHQWFWLHRKFRGYVPL